MGSASPCSVDDLNSLSESHKESGSLDDRKEKTRVVLTGFGPFGSHEINASTVTVQYLSKHGISDDIELFTYEMPVIYDKVTEVVPKLWDKHKPHLMIHTGVSSIAKELTLEHRAHYQGYYSCDVTGCKPSSHCWSPPVAAPAAGSTAGSGKEQAAQQQQQQLPPSINTELDRAAVTQTQTPSPHAAT